MNRSLSFLEILVAFYCDFLLFQYRRKTWLVSFENFLCECCVDIASVDLWTEIDTFLIRIRIYIIQYYQPLGNRLMINSDPSRIFFDRNIYIHTLYIFIWMRYILEKAIYIQVSNLNYYLGQISCLLIEVLSSSDLQVIH